MRKVIIVTARDHTGDVTYDQIFTPTEAEQNKNGSLKLTISRVIANVIAHEVSAGGIITIESRFDFGT